MFNYSKLLRFGAFLIFCLGLSAFSVINATNAENNSSMSSAMLNCQTQTDLENETWGTYSVQVDERDDAFNGDEMTIMGSYASLTFTFNSDGFIYDGQMNGQGTWSFDCTTEELSFNGNVVTFDGTGFLIPLYQSPGIYIKPISANHAGCTDTLAVNYDANAIQNEGCIYPMSQTTFDSLKDGLWFVNTTCVHEDIASFPFPTNFTNSTNSTHQVVSGNSRGINSEIMTNSSMSAAFFQGGGSYAYATLNAGYRMISGQTGSYAGVEISFFYNTNTQTFESLDGCYTIERAVVGCTDPSALNYYSYATSDNGNCFYALEEADLEKTYQLSSVNEECFASFFSNEQSFGFPTDPSNQETGRILSFSESSNGNIFYSDIEVLYESAWYDQNPNYSWGWGPSLQSNQNNGLVEFGDLDNGMTLAKNANGDIVAFKNLWRLEFTSSWITETLASDLKLAGFMFDDAFCVNSVWSPTTIACGDPNACNYADTADLFIDAYCSYPEPGFDCDGNCVAPDMTASAWSYYDWSGTTGAATLGSLQSGSALTVDVSDNITGEGATQNSFISQFQCGNFTLYNMSFANGGLNFTYEFDGTNYFWATTYTDPNTSETVFLALVQDDVNLGCTDETACNYDAAASMDNGACVYSITENILTSSNWAAESGFTCGDTQNNFSAGVSTSPGNQSYLVFNEDYTGELFSFNQGTPLSVNTFTWSIVDCEVVTSSDFEIGLEGLGLNADGKLVTFFNEEENVPSCYSFQWAPFQEMGCADANACNYVDPAPDYNAGCQYPQAFFDCDGNCLAPDLTDTSWDLYAGSPFSLGELQEANAVTFNDGGTATNQTATGFAVDFWTQNCGTISFSNDEPTIQFAQVTLYDSGMIQVRYLDNGSLFDRVLVPSGSVIGCMNENACNYDPTATINDQMSCTFPQGAGYDCDGVCQVSFDVTGSTWDVYSAVNTNNTLEGMTIDELVMSDALTLGANGEVSGMYFEGTYTWTQDCGLILIGDGMNEPNYVQVVNNGASLFQSFYNPTTNSSEFYIFLPVSSDAACTDETACNYDADATESDNTLCTYPEVGQDCDGNCVVEGTYLYVEFYDCSQYSPFEVTEANSPGVIASYEFILDGNGGVILNEYIGGTGFVQQNTTYTYDNCVLNIQGFEDFLPQADGSFIDSDTGNPSLCRALIPGSIGCFDPNACNYDPDAYSAAGYFMPGGICEYPAYGYDCEGVCSIDGDVTNTSWDINSATQPMTSIEDVEVVELLESNVITFNANGDVGGDYFGNNWTWTQDCGLILLENPDAAPYYLSIREDEMSIFFGQFNIDTQDMDWFLFTPASAASGCTDETACNYDADATESDNTLCTYPEVGQDCEGNCLVTFDISGTTWDVYDVPGWDGTEESAQAGELLSVGGVTFNLDNSLSGAYYEPGATWVQDCGLIRVNYEGQQIWDAATILNNGEQVFAQIYDFENQEYNVYLLFPSQGSTGCTDETACNYDADATESDNTLCTYPEAGFDCDGEVLAVMGCTYSNASNYNAEANDDDGSCLFSPAPVLGCTDDTAANYHAAATEDDGSCLYGTIVSCFGDFNDDSAINSGDLLMFLGVFGTSCE